MACFLNLLLANSEPPVEREKNRNLHPRPSAIDRERPIEFGAGSLDRLPIDVVAAAAAAAAGWTDVLAIKLTLQLDKRWPPM